MEEHFRPKEAFVTNINIDHISVDGLVNEVLELFWLHHITLVIYRFLIVTFVFFQYIITNISLLLFDLSCDFIGIFGLELLTTILEHLQSKLSNVSSSQWNALYTAANDVSIADWEHVSDTIAWVDDSASQVTAFNILDSDIRVWSSNLRKKCKSCLYSNEKTLDVERLEHNFRHLLSVFWSVHRGLSQHKTMLLRLTTQVRINGPMPVLLNTLPVTDLTVP